MSKINEVVCAIVILILVNFLLFTLYKYTQPTHEIHEYEEREIGEENLNQKQSDTVTSTNESKSNTIKENLGIFEENKEKENKKDGNNKTDTKQEEKPLFINAVDDSGEFRSLIPFYKSYKKNILSEEDYDINSENWKFAKFNEYAIPSLEGIKNRTEYKIKKQVLMKGAIKAIKQEPFYQTTKKSINDKRELKFLLKYARDVETGVRKDELEPEWQWAADISIVYTWVNGSDPIHLEQKSKYNGGIKKVDNRDRSVDELRYSLRSVLKNLPWHKGKIFIVTPGQTPDWLDPSYDRIQIINQEDILPKKDINGNDVNPTFNSFAIEWYLDQIPGVTEQFIQLNDDYFINHPLHPSYFFYGSGESYDVDDNYIRYYKLEYGIQKKYSYYFFKYYNNTKQSKITSELTYKEFLKNPSQLNNYYYCLKELENNLLKRKSFKLINEEHLSCILKIDSQTNKEKEKEENVDIDEEEKVVERKSLIKKFNKRDQINDIIFPNAARHYRFPNLYLALHFLIKDMSYAHQIGIKPFNSTTMSERFLGSLGMTNGAIKSVLTRTARINQLEHSPYVWYRDLFPMSRAKFQRYVNMTLTHKFRHSEDVIPPFANQAYLRYYASKEGFEKEFDEFYSSKYIYDTIEEAKDGNEARTIVRDRSILKFGFHIVEDKLRETTMRFGQIFDDTNKNLNLYKEIIERPNFLFFNLNDDYSEERVSEELHEFMNYLFPEKGEFEK
ncbi:hypothetical protein LY90DRAFT_677927 [Neocallimastix californiae]|uniref:Stealth protein CR2 conserved region 2 domain-containing protein n=1 Tax=Neocallimastix californiae TaxID=1754190 RepID=A0A1Y1ZL59_9FUNG|nr:hypothetical protein LY90DRAFT_677927 [Neocallimastix californiae]|eukprot:ORY11001.1 hypothetical protein LY90DRAFT_677927 [Neocallimastix californiae]